ncbi:pre-rRNA processing protein [Hirsutella rhossiliensis]|uniref:Pre-rRNA processing protein n=1 Tax=Hirsutella rhossiliensis TaxID=111463 RepID=A0A9P8N583_9HYPO|nr:pre-rRNA processing protein [Hirsutella rhossiliensis]KAH0967029.1 pre-rRNA processing protein [Hirsutella rhossiliensis]
MPDTEQSPLLAREDPLNESTPLLPDRQQRASGQQSGSSPSLSKRLAKLRGRWPWPSIIAILVLAALFLAIIILGFVTPPAVKQYVESAVVLEPTSLSLESLTAEGVRARIQANLRLDASRVSDGNARRIGKLVANMMGNLDTDGTQVSVRLPHYHDALLGTAVVPPFSIDLVDGHTNKLDFVADVVPGDAETLRKIVNEWLDGKLGKLKVTGAAALRLKSGIFPLGTHDVVESMVIQAKEVPSIPEYKIQRLMFFDAPIGLDVPSLGLQVLVPNCDPSQPNIEVATAVTDVIHVRPKADVLAKASGIIHEIPDSLTRTCPDTKLSPLDSLMSHYLHGENTQVSILESILVPIEFSGQNLDSLIRNFSLTDVDFKLPSPFADPKDPSGKPRVSGTVRVLAALPAELNVDIGVDGLKAVGNLFYEDQKFGELHLDQWQKANSSISSGSGDEDTITITSRVVDAPVDIIDSDIFGDIMQKLLFGDEDIILDVKSSVDARVATVLGKLVLRGIPATGKIPVKHIPGNAIGALNPQFGELRIINTSDTSVHLRAKVNLTNLTPYTAKIPYVSLHIMKQGYMIGEAVAEDVDLQIGHNSDISVSATWDPSTFGKAQGREAGRRLVSDYLSGKNTTVEVKAHRGTIPALPGEGDGREGSRGFIRDATFHILSSTATFTLASPLRHDTVHIQHINATAFYNHTEPIGQILHDGQMDVPPGLSQTPRLPVQWSASRVGLGKLREALGGSLRLDAVANVTVRLGKWTERIEYRGRGIGARVRLL